MTPNTTKILIGSAVGIGILYFILNGSDAGDGSADPTGNNGSAGNLDSFDANQVRLTLFNAMNQAGTDENRIIQALKYITVPQFDLVIKAFGKERYNDYFGYKTAGGTERDLLYWMSSEMNGSDEYINLQRKFKKLY